MGRGCLYPTSASPRYAWGRCDSLWLKRVMERARTVAVATTVTPLFSAWPEP